MKPRKPLNRKGKKTLEWERVRRELKARFLAAGITTCELRLPGCWRDNALGFAHSKKRREIVGDEIYEVILACNNCHDQVEIKPHEEMRNIILATIQKRRKQP